MAVEIIGSIVGGCAVIISAIITAIITKHKKDKNEPPPKSSISIHNINRSGLVVGNNNDVKYIISAKNDASIEIVDTLFDVKDDNFFIDIKLKNNGDRVAFVKRITFTMHEAHPLKNPQITDYSLVRSTAIYDVVLDGTSEQSFLLSQSIKANDIDRFRIKVASSIAETRMVTVYHFSYTLHYDNDKKTPKSPDFIASFPSTSTWGGYYVTHTSMEIAKNNYLELARISKIDCTKSDSFLSLLKSYEDTKTDFM